MARRLLVQADRPTASPSAETWQLIVPLGTWRHPRYGLVDNTDERIARYHANFQKGLKRQGQDGSSVLPFGIDHDDGEGASGWIRDTRIGPGGLEALVRWTPKGVAAITSEEYPFVSPDLIDAYTDPQTGEQHHDVLAGASLVMRPYFKNMPQVYLEHYCDDPEPTVLWGDPDNPELLQRAGASEDDMALDKDVRTPTEPTAGADPAAEQEAEVDSSASSSADGETAVEVEVGKDGARQVGEPQTFAEEVDAKQFREMRDQLEALQFRERVRQFSDELGGHSFGDNRRLAPGPREALADALASLPADKAGPVAEAVKAMRFYEPGEVGIDTAAAQTKSFSEHDLAVQRQLGLSEEDYE